MKNLLIVLLIIIAALSRLAPHPANFSPVAALALFGGVYLPKKYALLLPLGAMALSDLSLGIYWPIVPFVYGSFLLTGLIGIWLKNHKNFPYITGSAIISSLLFFIITNFGSWLDPLTGYERSLYGLVQSYIMGIPFYKNTFLGDLFYTLVLFGSYELAIKYLKSKLSPKLAKLLF